MDHYVGDSGNALFYRVLYLVTDPVRPVNTHVGVYLHMHIHIDIILSAAGSDLMASIDAVYRQYYIDDLFVIQYGGCITQKTLTLSYYRNREPRYE